MAEVTQCPQGGRAYFSSTPSKKTSGASRASRIGFKGMLQARLRFTAPRRESYPHSRRRIAVLPLALVLTFSGLLPLVVATTASATSPTFSNVLPATYSAGVHDQGYDSMTINDISCSSPGYCTAVGTVEVAPRLSNAVTVTSTNGTWGTPQIVTFAGGVANVRPGNGFNAVSCSSPGNCTAAGYFEDTGDYQEAMTQTSTNGVWANAVPATFAIGVENSDPSDVFDSISCSSAGDCTAAGQFLDANGFSEAMTETSTLGVWADVAPAMFANGVDNSAPGDVFKAISCSSAGNCAAAGQFRDANGNYEAMTETSTNGVWNYVAPATFATGVDNSAPNDAFNAISCAPEGECAAAGQFLDASGNYEAMIDSGNSYGFNNVQPATFAAGVENSSPDDGFEGVSCWSYLDCTAVGYFLDASGYQEAMTESVYGMTTSSLSDVQPVTYASGAHDPGEFYDDLSAVSCSPSGDCSAVGEFETPNGTYESMAQTSTSGSWANAQGLTYGTLHNEGYDTLSSISCSAPGDCTAAGSFTDVNGNEEAMTQTSTNGVWGSVQPATYGATAPDYTNPNDTFNAVSCSAPGDCTAAGAFRDSNGYTEAMTQTSTNGVWGNVQPATYDSTHAAAPLFNDVFTSVSCSAPGDCTAAGVFVDASGDNQAMTETSTNGVWAVAQPATYASGEGSSAPDDTFNDISCRSAGNCVAVGQFRDANGNYEAMTQTSTNGVWATADPASYAVGVDNASPNDIFNAVSCWSPGSCVAAGHFSDANGNSEAMTETSTNGVWAEAQPASYAVGVDNASPNDIFNAVSCSASGDCTAAGDFYDSNGDHEAMTQTSTNGVWATADPASYAVGVDNASPNDIFNAVSCWSPGSCVAAGHFSDANGNSEAMTETSTNGVWANAQPASYASGVDAASSDDSFRAVSCTSATNCGAAGDFIDTYGAEEAMTQSAFTTPATPTTSTSTSTTTPTSTTTTTTASVPVTTALSPTVTPSFRLGKESSSYTKSEVSVSLECFTSSCRGRARLYETVVEHRLATLDVDGKKVVRTVSVVKKLVLAVGTYQASAGQTFELPLKATAAGRDLLAKARKNAPLVEVVTTTVLGGRTLVSTFHVT